MKLTNKSAGLAVAAVALLMLGTAAIADKAGPMMRGMMDHGMTPPVLNFAAVDASKDGKISKDELSAFRTAQATSIDANKDGKLSVEEIAAMHLKRMTDAATNMAQNMVDRLDTDGDHLLAAAELADRPLPAAMFDRLDTNKDGFIDQAEADSAKQMMQDRMQRGGGRHGRHNVPMMQDGMGLDGMGGNAEN